MPYRLFVDEVGHADLRSSNSPNERYLALTGVIADQALYGSGIDSEFNRIKRQYFLSENVILHRRDILDRKNAFSVLKDEAVNVAFSDDLIDTIKRLEYAVITVAIDKKAHNEKYGKWKFHPYHYCLTCLVERYAKWLHRHGDKGDVLAESRNKNEDMALKDSYKRFHERGSHMVKDRVILDCLSTKELKLSKKVANNNGLQLVDLLANPSFRWMLCQRTGEQMTALFGRRIADVLATKYVRAPDQSVIGWGCKWLP
jgi:hypothetical protein